MRFYLPIMLLAACMSQAIANTSLPKGTIQEGTLSNEQLIYDAMFGVTAKVASEGCDEIEKIMPFVVAMPTGEIGMRTWKELWRVEGCGSKYPITISFTETGLGSAMWKIDN